MSRYTKQHHEDVADILLTHSLLVHTNSWTRDLVSSFADLFAADNPRRCTHCGDTENSQRFCRGEQTVHNFGGFDREQFLAACGLEPKT